ncbi:MAG: hypothetical protein EOP84_28575 [Verrucomicrobiaceae bacterium]|nr:MAG: hypothetical protein EOP84_28575 [Verrucomicrobiaceae bacterium]
MYKLHARNQYRWYTDIVRKGKSKRFRAHIIRQRSKPGSRRMRSNWIIYTPTTTEKPRWPYSRLWRGKGRPTSSSRS